MSGSKSLPPGDAQSVQPLELSVHTLPAPEALVGGERTSRGRWMMIFVVLLCALPVIASYFTFYVIQPRGQASFGELIVPAREMPAALPLRQLDGRAVDAAGLKGQWLLVVVDGGSCVADCEQHLLIQRQLREMLGRERERLDKLWLIADEAALKPALQESLSTTPAMSMLRTDAEQLSAWLQPATGHSLSQHFYLIDPMGRWMWRSPPQPKVDDAQKIKRVLDKLLRSSSSWDQAGRP